MFRISKTIRSLAFIFGVFTLSVSLSYVVSAVWQEPTDTPPDGNVAAPLNTGNVMQIKDAGLILNYSGNVAGFISLGAKTNPVAGLCPFGYDWYDYNSNTVKDNGECQRTALYTNGNGNVGIGTTNPGQTLDVNGNVQAEAFLYSSDERLKENIFRIESPLEKILKLNGVSFNWKDSGESGIGLTAQNVETVFPELVKTDKISGMKSVEYGNLVAPLIEAIKEQQKMIENQQKEIDALKALIK